MKADPWAELQARFGTGEFTPQGCADGIVTLWLSRERLPQVLHFLKRELQAPFRMLFDLTAVDERWRRHRGDHAGSDFTVVYLLYSLERNEFLRL